MWVTEFMAFGSGQKRPIKDDADQSQIWKFESDPSNLPIATSNSDQLSTLENDDREASPQQLIDANAYPFDLADLNLLQKAVLITESKLLDSLGGLKQAFQKERELGSLFNFVPVCLAIGIGAYFSSPFEPSTLALVLALVIMSVALYRTQSRGIQYASCLSICLIFSGMLAAQLQVQSANTPVPTAQITGKLTGLVLSVDQNQRGAPRYLIRPVSIESSTSDELPAKVRVSSSKKHHAFDVGDTISGLARLAPISGPAYPGGYDFSFPHWMRGLGLSGFFMGAPSPSATEINPSFSEQLRVNVQSARQSIAARIRAGLPGEPGDIAVALITGDRSGLSNETQESLRRSGLAHILAISGLHMALVTLTVIWIVRLILVFVPGLSEKAATKKWAIGAGFATATLYMAISGASIATQRAWLMITVMLIASLMDRRAITMRSVSIAAIIILLIDPASLFQPGFQMSFAAVAALVVLYQDWTTWKRKRIHSGNTHFNRSPSTNIFRTVGGYFAGLSATSLIAGIATALFAMWHFHRVAPLGLVSNLMAMPLVSLLVMPLSLLSMLLMPYGFEGAALAPLGYAIEQVVKVADGVNSYEFDFETGARPTAFLIAATLLLVIVTFLKTRLRWFAVFPLAALVYFGQFKPPLPDILIAPDGRNIAVRSELLKTNTNQAGLTLLYPKRSKFITDIWKRAYLPNEEFDTHGSISLCEKDICRFDLANKTVAVVYNPELIAEACGSADILLAPRLWWTNCRGKKPSLILNRTNLEANGSHALYEVADDLVIKTAWPKAIEGLERRNWLNRFENVSRRYQKSEKTTPNGVK